MKRIPRKAFVLAAGYGTRMLPLTRMVPKPLIPLHGKPLIVRTLELLREWGVREACINLHHLPEPVIEHLFLNPIPGLALGYSRETEILGTGGALSNARWFIEEGDPLWVVNADIAMHVDPTPLIRSFRNNDVISSCWLTRSAGPRTVEMNGGTVLNFRSEQPKTADTYTFCGLQLLSPRILDYLPPKGFSTIIEGYEAAMKDGHRIAGVEIQGALWADLGTPKQYLAAHALFSTRKSFVARGADVRIAHGAKIENSVLWDGSQIGAKAVLRDAIIGRGCNINFPVTGIALRARDALAPPELAMLETCGWNKDSTAIPLGPRGSARAFTRIRDVARAGILIHYDASRVENPLYASHARFLSNAGFPVPQIIGDNSKTCVTLLEDLGDASIQNTCRGWSERKIESIYRRVLEQILVLHGEASRRARRRRLKMVPAFRPRLYQWERDYFAEHFLQNRSRLPVAKIAAIKNDLKKIGRQLFHAPLVIVHRDLQSSNVILKNGRPVFIDFQGMRWGPAAYDLASLLADPYMELPEALQLRLLEFYAARCGDPTVRELFWPAVIQRLAQALGAFAKLGANRDTSGFADHIPPALRMMNRALTHVRGLPNLRAWCTATQPR